MGLTIRLEATDEDISIEIAYNRLHALRREMIDAAVYYIIGKQGAMREMLNELDVEEDAEDNDKMEEEEVQAREDKKEESEIKQKILAKKINHAKSALEEIRKSWLLDHDVIIKANNSKGKKGKELEEAHEAMELTNKCPAGINYEGIPSRSECSKDDKEWVFELELMGLVLFVSHSDSSGMYTPGEALDMLICIESMEERIKETLASKKSTGQKMIDFFDKFKEICKVSIDKRINICFT